MSRPWILVVMRRALVVLMIGCGNDIAPVDPPPAPSVLAISPAAFDFGNSDFTTTSTFENGFTLTNTGDLDVGVSAFSIGGAHRDDFAITAEGCPPTLKPGAACSITVQFQATARELRTGSLIVTGDDGEATAELTGHGTSRVALIIDPGSRNFGDIAAGTAGETIQFRVLNELADTAIAHAVVGDDAFPVLASTCTGVIALHDSCTIDIAFTPAHGGDFVADLTITGADQEVRAGMMGLSTSPLSASPFTSLFGSMLLGETGASRTIVVKNTTATGTGALSSQLIGAAAADFTIESSTCASLAPDETCEVVVRHAAQTRGAKHAALAITDATSGLATHAALRADAYALFLSGTASFPDTPVGQTSAKKLFKILNASSSSTGAITATVGDGFTIVTSTCAAGIAPNGFCELEITFTPAATGATASTLSVSSSPGGSDSRQLDGIGL